MTDTKVGHLPLTAREVEVLRHTAEGHDNRQIGVLMFLTEDTVKSHLRRINAKTGARNRAQAVAIAFREGLIPLEPNSCCEHCRGVRRVLDERRAMREQMMPGHPYSMLYDRLTREVEKRSDEQGTDSAVAVAV